MINMLPSLIQKKKYLVFGIVIISLILVKVLFLKTPDNTLIYTVKQESLVDTVQVSGTYTIATTINVLSPAKGIITKLYVKNGDSIEKDKSLFYVESTATTEEKAKAYADLIQVKSNFESAKATQLSLQSAMFNKWNIFKNLAENDTYSNSDDSPKYENRSAAEYHIAEKDWLAAESKYKTQETVVVAAQAAYVNAQLAYQATQNITVKSPASGVIANLQKDVGDQITANDAPVLVVANYDNPTIEVSINEAYIPRIQLGQKAHVVFDALKTQTHEGILESLDSIGDNNNGTVTYKAKLKVKNLPQIIKPNMTALVTIETLRKDSVLTVPNSAILMKDDKYFVYQKVTPAKFKLIEVTLGSRGVTQSEVTSGVSENTVLRATANSQ